MINSVMVGSGWWCSSETPDERNVLYGDDDIRSSDFFELWHESVFRSIAPNFIVVIDSASPTKPDLEVNKVDCWIELPYNAGHATNCESFFCGWTNSVINSISYFLTSPYEHYAYVEQDVLLNGKIDVSALLNASPTGMIFGRGGGVGKHPLQQSLFLLNKKSARIFLSRLIKINRPDSEITPELKFAIATSRLLAALPADLFCLQKKLPGILGTIYYRLLNDVLVKLLGNIEKLPFGYGRDRPINFSDDSFYFQHGTKQELSQYKSIHHSTTS